MHGDGREVGKRGLEVGSCGVQVHAVFELDEYRRVDVLGEQLVVGVQRDEVARRDRAGVLAAGDADDFKPLVAGAGEPHLQLVAHSQSPAGGDVLCEHDCAGGQGRQVAVHHAEVGDVGEGGEIDGRDRLGGALLLPVAVANSRDGLDAVDVADPVKDVGGQPAEHLASGALDDELRADDVVDGSADAGLR